MKKLNFYVLPDKYIAYMSTYDKRICYNKEHKRPYIGIVFKVENINYFAPFASPKPKHKMMRQAIDYVKIDDGNLGLINLNNMIPVPMEICERVDLKMIEDTKYKRLMQKQYLWCNIEGNYNNIIQKAKRLYYLVSKGTCNKSLMDRCCDYRLLEKEYLKYMKEK